MSDAPDSLLNLGPKSNGLLRDIGVTTVAQLEALGAVPAYCLLKSQGHAVSLNLLWALHGALTGQRWDRLSAETKTQLKADVAAFRFSQ